MKFIPPKIQKYDMKDVTRCVHRLGIYCESELCKEYNHNQMMAGCSPFICPFTIGNECREYRELKHNEV